MKINHLMLGGIVAFVVLHTAPDLLADAPLRSVVVTHTDGSSFSVALSGSLTLSFSDEALILEDVVSGLEVGVPRARLASFSLSSREAALDDVGPDVAVSAPVVTEAGVTLGSLPDGAVVRAFSPSGALLFERKAAGDCFLPRILFASGVNVVEINGNPYKIILR